MKYEVAFSNCTPDTLARIADGWDWVGSDCGVVYFRRPLPGEADLIDALAFEPEPEPAEPEPEKKAKRPNADPLKVAPLMAVVLEKGGSIKAAAAYADIGWKTYLRWARSAEKNPSGVHAVFMESIRAASPSSPDEELERLGLKVVK